MACCGKSRKNFQDKIAKAKFAIPVRNAIPVITVKQQPLTRVERIKIRQERIRRRAERKALRQAKIYARNAKKENIQSVQVIV